MGVHSASIDEAGDLLIEWYNFGEDVAYEYVSIMVFDSSARRAFATALGLEDSADAEALIEALAARFRFFFDIEQFATRLGIACGSRTDFSP